MRSPLTMRTRCAIQLSLTVLISSSPFALSRAVAQQAAAPAASLDPITVEGQKQKKKAATSAGKSKAKAATAKQAAPQAEPAVAEVEPPSGTGKATKPGLNLENPNTGGSRLGLTPLETPASIEVISGDTARERGQTSVVDAVTQNAAGISSNAVAGNGGTSMVSRGFAGHGSVATLYDGSKLHVAAGTVTFPFNTWSADRIEVLRGPASVLYGDGAIGGVINVVPKKPTDTFVNEAEVSIGTDWTRRLSFGSGGPISDKLSYRFDVTGEQSNGWVDDGDFRNAAVSGALRYKASSDLVFTLSSDYGYQEPTTYWGTPLIDGKIDKRLRFRNFNVEDGEIEYRDTYTQFKTEWQVNPALKLRNNAYYLTTDRHWKNAEMYTIGDFDTDGDNVLDLFGGLKRESYTEIYHDETQIGDRLDATLRHRTFGLPMQTVVGFDVNRAELTYRSNFSIDEPGYPEDYFPDPFNFDRGSWGTAPRARPHYSGELVQASLFGEHRVELTDQLSVIGGVRLDTFDLESQSDTVIFDARREFSKEFTEFTWRVGAVYELVPGLAFYGQYATAVDPAGSATLTLTAGRSDFDMTRGRQVEIGVKQSFWGGRGEWTIAAYDIVKTDLIESTPVRDTFRLVGEQSSYGVEGSLALQLTEALRVEGNVALLQAQYDGDHAAAGNQPVDVPEELANLWVSYRFLPRWTARGGLQYVGRRFADQGNEVALDAYTLLNAGIDYQVTDSSTLSLRGYNLTDEIYAVTSSYESDWVLGRPRSADLTYRIKF